MPQYLNKKGRKIPKEKNNIQMLKAVYAEMRRLLEDGHFEKVNER